MKETLHIIALRTVRYSDRNDILSAFSLERGPVSFLIPAGKGREASRRRALLMPLGAVECSADIRPDRSIHQMTSPRLMAPLHSLRVSPVKSALTMFVAEALSVLLREAQPDATLWRFIMDSVLELDAMPERRSANFHICFLVRLGALLGIEPDTSLYAPGRIFDMIDGTFRASAPAHSEFLTGDEAAAAALVCRLTYRNMYRLKMSRNQRGRLLEGVLRYYALHYAPIDNLRSTAILHSLF